MTLEEQFRKEKNIGTPEWLDIKEFDAYALKFQYAFNDWLKEKLTWKKFSEKKPEVGCHTIISSMTNLEIHKFISSEKVDFLTNEYPESEWMYVPE